MGYILHTSILIRKPSVSGITKKTTKQGKIQLPLVAQLTLQFCFGISLAYHTISMFSSSILTAKVAKLKYKLQSGAPIIQSDGDRFHSRRRLCVFLASSEISAPPSRLSDELQFYCVLAQGAEASEYPHTAGKGCRARAVVRFAQLILNSISCTFISGAGLQREAIVPQSSAQAKWRRGRPRRQRGRGGRGGGESFLKAWQTEWKQSPHRALYLVAYACMLSLTRSLSITLLIAPLLTHSHSFTHSLTNSPLNFLSQSLTHSSTHLFIQLPTLSLPHSQHFQAVTNHIIKY